MITLAAPRDRRIDTALLVLRLVAGVIFFAHGWQKAFVIGLGGITAGFTQMGVPMPEIAAPLISGLELIGGLALILGLWTRMFSALLACEMFGAMLFVHLQNGFFLPNGIEFVLMLCAAAATLALAGAGTISVDDAMQTRRTVELARIDDMIVRDRVRPTVKL